MTAKALHATDKGHIHKCNSSAWTTIGYSGAKFLVGSRIFNEEGNLMTRNHPQRRMGKVCLQKLSTVIVLAGQQAGRASAVIL